MPKTKEEKKIWLFNYEIQNIYQWCFGMMLHGEFARMRNKVMEYFTPLMAAYEADRIKTLEEYATKDADGKPIVIDNKYEFTPEQREIANDVLSKLLNEEVPVTLDKPRKEILGSVKRLLKEQFKTPLDMNKGKIYDELLDKLESI